MADLYVKLSVLTLLQTCFDVVSQIHLSADARNLVDNVCLLLHEEGVIDLSEVRTEGGSAPEHRSAVETTSRSAL